MLAAIERGSIKLQMCVCCVWLGTNEGVAVMDCRTLLQESREPDLVSPLITVCTDTLYAPTVP